MRSLISLVLFISLSWSASAEEGTFAGTWRTTNRPLDGTMTCVVKDLGTGKWTGRFFGVWQGVPFDYTVPFEGEPAKLQGKATIDGASYTWLGSMSADSFRGSFSGSRYAGSFELKTKPIEVAAKPR